MSDTVVFAMEFFATAEITHRAGEETETEEDE